MERYLESLEAREAEDVVALQDYERKLKAAEVARAAGLIVAVPEPPKLGESLRAMMRLSDSPTRRASWVARSAAHPRPDRIPPPPAVAAAFVQSGSSSGAIFLQGDHVPTAALLRESRERQLTEWLLSHLIHRGMFSGFETAYQNWMVLASLLLRDEDIGAIIARIHPERCEGRSPRLSADEVRKLNADLARQERKAVREQQRKFGFPSGMTVA